MSQANWGAATGFRKCKKKKKINWPSIFEHYKSSMAAKERGREEGETLFYALLYSRSIEKSTVFILALTSLHPKDKFEQGRRRRMSAEE